MILKLQSARSQISGFVCLSYLVFNLLWSAVNVFVHLKHASSDFIHLSLIAISVVRGWTKRVHIAMIDLQFCGRLCIYQVRKRFLLLEENIHWKRRCLCILVVKTKQRIQVEDFRRTSWRNQKYEKYQCSLAEHCCEQHCGSNKKNLPWSLVRHQFFETFFHRK